MRTKWMPILIAAAAASAGTAAAGPQHESRYAYARVVDVEPIVRLVTVERPRRECWEETVYQSDLMPRPFGGAGATLAGAIVGGAIGRQFGGGSGRDAMTLIGTVAGAAVANERSGRRREAYRAASGRLVPVERCEVIAERVTEERIDGYRVTYQYQGQRYRMRTSRPPEDRIRVRVDVRPVGF